MSELRLVPSAATVWIVTLAILTGMPWLVGIAACVAGACVLWRQWGQALLVVTLGICAGVVTTVRQLRATAFSLRDDSLAHVASSPKELVSGSWLVPVRVSGYPSVLPVFTDSDPGELVAGTPVVVRGSARESDRPGVGSLLINGEVVPAGEPQGFHAFAAGVRGTFRQAVESAVPEHSQGLIPGMVLGDTSLQSAAEQDAYIATGLSHLSAVSGANVAILATAVVIVARALRAGLRVQVVAAGVSILVFAGLVGAEPSVLRATVTGIVGLVAVLTSSRAEPMHTLCLAVIGLVLVDSDLAVNYGFALSVAATVGIVALYPLLYRALAPTGWPDILVKALAVAIAADLMTMPIIALMAGEVSLVSVLANVLVAPATAPVTVLGLVAVLLSFAPGGLEQVLFLIIQPCTWWIHTVGHALAAAPVATVPARPLTVIIGYGWVIAGFLYGRPRLTVAVVAVGIVSFALVHQPRAPERDIAEMVAHVVDKHDDIEPVPPGTELVVVRDPTGRPAERGTVTAGGIPVIYPNRDGYVRLYTDGTHHAADGRF